MYKYFEFFNLDLRFHQCESDGAGNHEATGKVNDGIMINMQLRQRFKLLFP